MSDTPLDTPAPDSVASTPVAAGTPAELPAPTTGPADTAVSGQPKDGEGEQPDKPTRDRRTEKRIASLTRKNDEAQQQIGYWRGIAEAQKGQGQPAQAADPDVRPQPSQFKSYDEYVEALTDWKTDQKLNARDTAKQQTERTQAETSKANERNQALADRLVSDGKGIEEFIEDVMKPITAKGFPISAAMRDYLEESDKPALMAQYLVDNLDQAELIYGMSSTRATRELDKVAATLTKPAQVSKAPPPGPTVGGRTVVSRSPEEQSMDEYGQDWKARQAKRHA